MDTTVKLDARHYSVAVAKAQELGQTPDRYIESLIDAATMTFDEILAPVRAGFQKSGMTEVELDELIDRARTSVRQHKASDTEDGL